MTPPSKKRKQADADSDSELDQQVLMDVIASMSVSLDSGSDTEKETTMSIPLNLGESTIDTDSNLSTNNVLVPPPSFNEDMVEQFLSGEGDSTLESNGNSSNVVSMQTNSVGIQQTFTENLASVIDKLDSTDSSTETTHVSDSDKETNESIEIFQDECILTSPNSSAVQMPESNEDAVVLERVQDHLHEILSHTRSFTRDVADLKLDTSGFHDSAKSHVSADVMNFSSSAVCEDMFQTFRRAIPIAERDGNNGSHLQQDENSLMERNEMSLESNGSSQGIFIQETTLPSENIKNVTFSHVDCRVQHETSLKGGNEMSSESEISSESEMSSENNLNEKTNHTDEVTNFNSTFLEERIEQHLQDKSELSMENATELKNILPSVLADLEDDSTQEGRQYPELNIGGGTLEGQCCGNISALLPDTFEGSVPKFEVTNSTPKKTDTPGAIIIPLSPINEESSFDRTKEPSHTSESDDQENCDISSASSALYSTLNSNSSSVISDEANIQQHSRTVDMFQKFIGLNTLKLHSNTDQTVTESILEIMKTFLKNHDSKATLSRNVKTIAKLLPTDHNLPSGETILNYVKGLIPSISEEKHYYCKQCVIYREKSDINKECCVCLKHTDVSHFYQFSVAGIAKYLFENRCLASIMDSAAASFEYMQSNIYKDVQSGSEYKRINRDRGRYDLTMILNSDGVQVKKKSRDELRLLLCTFVEIPNHLREAFLCVLGVWYDRVKPYMNTFMKPYCEEMAKISKEGIEWKHPVTGEIHKSFVRLQVVVADAPARAKMQNILLHNGRYGCSICEIKTVKCTLQEGMKKRIRVYPYVHNPILRSEERMVTQAERALVTGSCVKGVKGASVLSTIPQVDISTLFIPEYMHSVLLGVTRQCLDTLLNKSGPWNIKKYSLSIDEDLAAIRHPDFVHRFARQVKNLKNWKASDCYYFLLFEALPTLKLYLPVKYYQHFILLVVAIFKLLKRDITDDDIVKADLLLNFFVNQFGDLYSDRELSSNIHNLCHLALCVRRHGPLSCTSAFPFEGMNGLIAKSTHGTLNVGQEIVNNIQICQGVQILKKIVEGVDAFSFASHQSFSSGEPLGKEAELSLSPEEISLFKGREFNIYCRAKIGCEIFTSEIHKQLKSANFYVMWKERCDKSNEKEHIGTVKFFAVVDNELHVCLKFWKVDHLNVIFHEETMTTVDHLFPVLETSKICLVNTSDLTLFEKVGKCSNFVFRRPNLLHQVM